MKVKEVDHKRWLKAYFELLKKVYKNDRNFVYPLKLERKEFLNPSKNPFFKHAEWQFITAEENGDVFGVVIPFIDKKYNEYHKEKGCHFGFFECVNDKEIASLLMERVSAFALGRGMEVIRGPFNFSTNHECGLLVQGFDSPPVILMTYNPPYYEELLRSSGYEKAKDLLAYKIERKPISEALREICENIKKTEKVFVKNMRKKDFEILVDLALEIYNDAWSENWGFVPMDREEFVFVARGLKFFLDEDISFFVVKDEKPIGFSISLPDYNFAIKEMKGKVFPFGIIKFLLLRKKIKNARIFALGIKKEFHDKGFAALLYFETWRSLLEKGYQWAEMSWILEDNYRMRRAIELAGGKVYKVYRILEKRLPA